ncbi:MAG: hypothetical protein QM791_04345 [Ferruginibacter sp.]
MECRHFVSKIIHYDDPKILIDKSIIKIEPQLNYQTFEISEKQELPIIITWKFRAHENYAPICSYIIEARCAMKFISGEYPYEELQGMFYEALAPLQERFEFEIQDTILQGQHSLVPDQKMIRQAALHIINIAENESLL